MFVAWMSISSYLCWSSGVHFPLDFAALNNLVAAFVSSRFFNCFLILVIYFSFLFGISVLSFCVWIGITSSGACENSS